MSARRGDKAREGCWRSTRHLHGLWLLVIVLGCGPRPEEMGPIAGELRDSELPATDLFQDVTNASGIDFSYRNGEDGSPLPRAILETLGGGVALLDYDADGLLDVFVTGGGEFAGADNQQIRGHASKLFRNCGGWKFEDVTARVGLDVLADGQPWFYSHGAAVVDYDRDGWPDLLVTGWGRIALFRNVPDLARSAGAGPEQQGGRRFEDVSFKAGLAQGITWATSAAWGDLDGDGWPDLYVCQYVDWSFQNHPLCAHDGQHPEACPPKMFQGLPHKLYRNGSGGALIDVSKEVGLNQGGAKASKGLGAIMVDINLDGKPEIYVANDTTDNFLYVNHSFPGRIQLREEGMLVGVARDDNGSPNGSMGVDAGDPDGGGLPWLWVSNYENEFPALYRNLSSKDRIAFVYHTLASGVGVVGRGYVGWGTGFVDIDHDGWEDLFVANGHVVRHHPLGMPRPQRPVLLRNRNGKFQDVTTRGGNYFRHTHSARGVALGDLDNDGKVDLVVSHLNEPIVLLRNVASEGNHWLGVQLACDDQADIIGARVLLEAGGRKQTRFAKGGGSYASASDRRFVFGLGKTDRIDKLTLTWPNGWQQTWTDLGIDRYHVLYKRSGEAHDKVAK